jgi:molybdate transport system substrate-binding protein
VKKYLLCAPLFLSLLVILHINLSFAEPVQEITVSAAISLKNAFEEIGQVIAGRNPGTKVRFNFGASGDLARQIEVGAPVDVFASAAQKDMDDIDQKGFITPGTRMNFAGNSVVLVKSGMSQIRMESFEDLRKAEVKKIVIGNPKSVPAGRYAEEVLKYLNLWEVVKDKLIFAEHVRQALDYVARNEVDAAMVYSTDAVIRPKEVRIVTKAPDKSHQPIVYPIGIVKGSKNQSLAKEFTALVLSTEGKNLLSKYGFETVK